MSSDSSDERTLAERFPSHPDEADLTAMGLYNNPAGVSVWYRRKYAELRQWAIELSENTSGVDQSDPDTPTR